MDVFSSDSDSAELLGKTTEKNNTCKCNACQLNKDICCR